MIVESRLVSMFRLIEGTPALRNGQKWNPAYFCHKSSLSMTSGNQMYIVGEVADKEASW